MAGIPHADGPYADVTKYGVKKATAVEVMRQTLEACNAGWISAVGDCSISMVSGKEVCLLKVRVSKGPEYIARIVLVPGKHVTEFPIRLAEVNIIDSRLTGNPGGKLKVRYEVTRDELRKIPNNIPLD